MSYVGPTQHLPDGTPIPPIRRISVYVPDADGLSILCSAVVWDLREKLAQIEIGPLDGPYQIGDFIEYAWLSSSEFPVVKAGRGQF